MAIECEAKLKVDDLDAVRDKLAHFGGVDEGEVMERNWVLDRPDGDLFASGILLRVRNNGQVGGVLTVKHAVEGGEFKSKEEVESMVDSTEDLLRQLEIVGFRVKWIYEKRRATWLWRDCIIALDQCPELGNFVEIEGDAERIREVAAAVGLNSEDHINDSYLVLWQDHLRRLGETLPRHMVFPPEDEYVQPEDDDWL